MEHVHEEHSAHGARPHCQLTKITPQKRCVAFRPPQHGIRDIRAYHTNSRRGKPAQNSPGAAAGVEQQCLHAEIVAQQARESLQRRVGNAAGLLVDAGYIIKGDVLRFALVREHAAHSSRRYRQGQAAWKSSACGAVTGLAKDFCLTVAVWRV